jgi:hypothetical protein
MRFITHRPKYRSRIRNGSPSGLDIQSGPASLSDFLARNLPLTQEIVRFGLGTFFPPTVSWSPL